jgi:hypothetical protein
VEWRAPNFALVGSGYRRPWRRQCWDPYIRGQVPTRIAIHEARRMGVLRSRESRHEPLRGPTGLAALAVSDAAARMPSLDNEVVGGVSYADDDELGNVGPEEMG